MERKSKKIKILFTIPNFDTAGTGNVLLNIAEALDPELFETEIMCLHDRGYLFDRVRSSGIPYHIYPYYHSMSNRVQGLKQVFKTAGAFRKTGADIIHSFNYGSDYSEGLAARLSGTKWVFTKKNMSWGGSSKNAWKLRSALANEIIIQNTDMRTRFYPNSTKAHLVARGVKWELFDNKGEFGRNDGTRELICVANLVPKKGVEILLRAFAKIKNEFPQWILKIVGEDTNEYAQKLKIETKELGLDNLVEYTGKQPDVKSFLDKSEIFILPTNTMGEGSPVAVLEAMANGKVVIGSAVPGIKDQLAPYPGHLFDVNDADQLADRLSRFMRNSTEQNRAIGQQFAEYVRSNYSFDKEVKMHTEIYKRLAGINPNG